MSLGTITLIFLVLMLLGVAPTWSHSRSWGYVPSGVLGMILVIVVILWDDISNQEDGPEEKKGKTLIRVLRKRAKKTKNLQML